MASHSSAGRAGVKRPTEPLKDDAAGMHLHIQWWLELAQTLPHLLLGQTGEYQADTASYSLGYF